MFPDLLRLLGTCRPVAWREWPGRDRSAARRTLRSAFRRDSERDRRRTAAAGPAACRGTPPACTTDRRSSPTSPPWPADRRNRPDSASPSSSAMPDSRRRESRRRRRTDRRGGAETPAATRRPARPVPGRRLAERCRARSSRRGGACCAGSGTRSSDRLGPAGRGFFPCAPGRPDSAGCFPSALRRLAAGPRRRTRIARPSWDGIAGEPATAGRRLARSLRSWPRYWPAWRACPSRGARSTLSAPQIPRPSACTRSSPRRRRTRRRRPSDRRASGRAWGGRCRSRRSRAARRAAGRARPHRPATARPC